MNRRIFLASALAAIDSGKSIAQISGRANADDPAQRLLEKLSRDPLRPQYHLLPQAGSVGDPCAPRFFEGQNHVFFHGSFGGRGWSHARSSDLIHWEHLPKALTPSENSYDSYGTFTGSVLPGGPGASIIYTGVTRVPPAQETIRNEGLREVQCIATSDDKDLRSWHKLDRPVIEMPPSAPKGSKIVGFRDPFSWQDGKTWYAGVGSGFEHIGGAVLLYRSRDRRNWEYLHPVAQGTWNEQIVSNPVGSGEMWECPDLFPLGNKHVLIYSTAHKVIWQVGTLDKREMRFNSERDGVIDYGTYYAPKSMLDRRGRRILWGWVQENRPQEELKAAGWSGAISLPRLLTLGPDSELQMEVPPEFVSLRSRSRTLDGPFSAEDLNRALAKATFPDRAGEVICRFKPSQSGGCRIELRLASPAGTVPLLAMTLGAASGGGYSVTLGDQVLPLSPDRDGLSTLHIWVDGSVIETFIDRKWVITTRSYAAPDESGEGHMAWLGAAEAVKSIEVSSIKPISTDRLTA